MSAAIAFFGFDVFSERLLDKNFLPEVNVTPKPLKLLKILAREGLSLKESASKLCISVDTANKHVATFKQSLGATTLANAVYLATERGIIADEE